MEKIKEIEYELTSMDFPLNIIPKWDTFTNLDDSMKNKVVHTTLTLVDILKGYKVNKKIRTLFFGVNSSPIVFR
jgi:hypothetical protein